MPRARRRCANASCKRWQPCPVHPQGWRSGKSKPLPRDWNSKKKAVKIRSGGRCEVKEAFGPFKRRCNAPGQSVDHIIPRAEGGSDNLTNLQMICYTHHKLKSRLESQRGIKRKFGKET